MEEQESDSDAERDAIAQQETLMQGLHEDPEDEDGKAAQSKSS